MMTIEQLEAIDRKHSLGTTSKNDVRDLLAALTAAIEQRDLVTKGLLRIAYAPIHGDDGKHLQQVANETLQQLPGLVGTRARDRLLPPFSKDCETHASSG